MKVLRLKDYILTKRENKLIELGFERRYDTYTGKISYYEGKGSHIMLPSREIEAIWCCGEMDEYNYTGDIYNLITNNMVELIDKKD